MAPSERNAACDGLSLVEKRINLQQFSDAEADLITSGTERTAHAEDVFEPGELVRVIDGPFNDFSGVVEEVNYEEEPPARGGNYFRTIYAS